MAKLKESLLAFTSASPEQRQKGLKVLDDKLAAHPGDEDLMAARRTLRELDGLATTIDGKLVEFAQADPEERTATLAFFDKKLKSGSIKGDMFPAMLKDRVLLGEIDDALNKEQT